MSTLQILLLASIIVIILLAIAIASFIIVKKKKIKKMHLELDNFFNKYVEEHNDSKLEKINNGIYDYKLTTSKSINYIKIVPNLSSDEITINNSVTWQLKKSYNDEKPKYVPNIEPFMNYDLSLESNNDSKEIDTKNEEVNLFNQDKELTFSDLDLNINNNITKKNKKIFLIYPNARLLLMYINECEMKFVTPKTNINGSNVITFVDLMANKDSLLK